MIKVYTPSLSVLFLGDLDVEGGKQLLNSEFAEEVPSDIVQVSHHGQNGDNKEFYKRVKAKIALWCAPEWVYNPDEDHQFLNAEHTKRWLRELGCENNFVTKNGDYQLEFTKNSLKIKL